MTTTSSASDHTSSAAPTTSHTQVSALAVKGERSESAGHEVPEWPGRRPHRPQQGDTSGRVVSGTSSVHPARRPSCGQPAAAGRRMRSSDLVARRLASRVMCERSKGKAVSVDRWGDAVLVWAQLGQTGACGCPQHGPRWTAGRMGYQRRWLSNQVAAPNLRMRVSHPGRCALTTFWASGVTSCGDFSSEVQWKLGVSDGAAGRCA